MSSYVIFSGPPVSLINIAFIGCIPYMIFKLNVTIQVSEGNPSILTQILRSIKSRKNFMLSKVQKNINYVNQE